MEIDLKILIKRDVETSRLGGPGRGDAVGREPAPWPSPQIFFLQIPETAGYKEDTAHRRQRLGDPGMPHSSQTDWQSSRLGSSRD